LLNIASPVFSSNLAFLFRWNRLNFGKAILIVFYLKIIKFALSCIELFRSSS
jgi:hypothetical protein